MKAIGASQRSGIFIADCSNVTVFQALEIPDNIRTPITVSDDAHTNRLTRISPLGILKSRGDVRGICRWIVTAKRIYLGSHQALSKKLGTELRVSILGILFDCRPLA